MSAINQSGWRPTTPEKGEGSSETFTGNRALMLNEPLIFEIGSTETTGVDFAEAPSGKSRLGGLERTKPINLPGLSEPEAVRHYTRLSRQNYAIDLGLFPLGSCTMKHNPRLNERMARLPGFADIHPLQPVDTVQGAFEVIHQLAHWLVTLTGMHSVAMSPKAGAHGELCGILAIRAALDAKGQQARKILLVPESAHGTNPATAAFAGFSVQDIPATADGRVDLEALKARLGPDIAGVMITNPNTCGLFEPDLKAISDAVHAAGAMSIVTAPTSTRSSAGSARATSASTRCTSTCTRPSRRRMAAVVRARVRSCSPKRSPPMRRCPSSRSRANLSPWSRKRPPASIMPAASAGWSPSTARWGCSRAR